MPALSSNKPTIIVHATFTERLLRHWGWILAVVTIIGFGAGSILLWAPEYARLRSASIETIAARENEIRALQHTIGELEVIQKEFQSLPPERVARVFSALPRALTFTDLMLRMSVAAARHGFTLDAFSMQRAPEVADDQKTDIETVTVNARLAGIGYTQWKGFLQTIEEQLPIFDLSSTQFNNTAEFQEFLFRTYQMP